KEILEFINSFVGVGKIFMDNLKSVLSNRTTFDLEQEKSKIVDAEKSWRSFLENPKKFSPETIESFHFYLSGKEYGFARYGAVPLQFCSVEEFLKRFEKHFKIERGKDMRSFLQVESHGTTDHSPTRAELLKFWWARRIQNISNDVDVSNLPKLEVFSENVLKDLVVNKEKIPRADAQRFLTAGLSSDLRAKLGVLSRKHFVSRNVLQITNGSQTLLQYSPKEWGQFPKIEISGKTSAQRRRKKLAARPLLTKLQKRLARTQGNLKLLPSESSDRTTLEERIRILSRKIERLEKGKSLFFSDEAKDTLKRVGITENKNQDLANRIWDVIATVPEEQQKQLLRVLGEMPHSWAIILKTKQEIPYLQKLQEQSLVFTKDQGGTFGPHDGDR